MVSIMWTTGIASRRVTLVWTTTSSMSMSRGGACLASGSFSTNANNNNNNNNNSSTTPKGTVPDDGGFLVGRVKFFDRKRFYGFIQPLHDPKMEIFVHRSNIVSNLDRDQFPMNPFLLKKEIVRFKLGRYQEDGDNEEVSNDNDSTSNDNNTKENENNTKENKKKDKPRRQLFATDVTWEDGSPIPPLRSQFLRSKLQGIHLALGQHVDTILSSAEKQGESGEVVLERVLDAWKLSKSTLEQSRELIQRLGMHVKDFPLGDDKEKDQDTTF